MTHPFTLSLSFSLSVVVVVTACSTRTAAPGQDPALTWNGDSVVAPLLRVPVLGRAQMTAADSIASVHRDFDARLAAVAADTTAPPLIRANAILLYSDRGLPTIEVYLDVLDAGDDRVRAAGLVALKPFLKRWSSGIGLVRKALHDSSSLVQARALEILGDGYVDDLRAYVTRTRDGALRTVALDLIGTAEERGAPLVPDSTGALQRTAPAGPRLIYKPRQRWDDSWGVALGKLQVAVPGKPLQTISDSVEVVRNVVPAFFSADGRYLVYEANRLVRVRDLATGADRIVDRGSAPRLVPFSSTFIYVKQVRARADQPQPANTLRYDVMQAPLSEGSGKAIGQLHARARHEVNGYASAVRWMRVREADGKFQLTGDLQEPFALPDPFGVSK
jgi:hypothetical protein